MPECHFCNKQIQDDQVYVAWDWDVCRECFQEMEKDVYETHMNHHTHMNSQMEAAKINPQATLDFAYGEDYGDHMDPECVDICNILNSLPGIETTESCCGHGNRTFVVFFNATGWRGLAFLGRCLDQSYSGYEAVTATLSNTDMPHSRAHFILEVNDHVGDEAYTIVRNLCAVMREHLNLKCYMNNFHPGMPGFIVREKRSP